MKPKMTIEEKQARAKERNEAKEKAKTEARILSEKNQKPVKEMTINIEWKKSRMWGNNPNCEARVAFADGTYERSPVFKCSGCGYDKESTVIADVFNQYLKYKLWKLSNKAIEGGHGSLDKGKAPYGINRYDYDGMQSRSFAGGIGTECYNAISKYIGGEFTHVSSGKTFDVYKYTEKK